MNHRDADVPFAAADAEKINAIRHSIRNASTDARQRPLTSVLQ
jgi:hypothetical protein